MKNKFYRLKLINSQKKDENNISNKTRSKGNFSSFKSYQTEPKNIPIAKSLNSSNPKKKGNGNYNMMKGELSSIRTSLAYISKNMRILNQQNQVLINTFKSEKDRTTKAFKLMKNELKETKAAIKEMKAELIGMKKEQQETNKLLKKLISIIKKEKKVSIQVNKDNMNKKDNIIQFMN